MSLESFDNSPAGGSGGLLSYRGAAIGAAVWLVGFLLTFVFATLSFPVLGGLPELLLLYLGIHLYSVIGLGTGVLAAGPAALVVAVPVAVTLAGGTAAVARPERGGFLEGASIATGYFVATLTAFGLAVVLLGDRMAGAPGLYGLNFRTGLALVADGFVQPALLGGVGGLIADLREV